MQELVDEITLPFTRNLCCGFYNYRAVGVVNSPFLDIEQTHFLIALIWHIVIFAFDSEITLIAQFLKQSVLSDFISVLRKDFCKLAD